MNKKLLIGLVVLGLALIGLAFYAANRTDDTPNPTPIPPTSTSVAETPSPAPTSDPAAMKTFEWEEFGVTFTMPEDWDWLADSPEFDLALISPDVKQFGNGAYITIEVYPSLGPGVTPESALQPVADENDTTIEPFPGGGVGVAIPDEANGVVQNIVVYPYNDMGAVLVMQTAASPNENATVLNILGNMEIHPPHPDADAADAAFLASMEDNESGALSYGSPDAPVVMREYLSFTCGHCAQYTLSISNLLALEVESGRVRFELSPVSWDDNAEYAAQAFYCAAAQGKGYSAYKALYRNYLTLGYEEAYTEDAVREAMGADGVGLDMDAFDQCISEKSYAGLLEKSNTAFADYGLSGTPTVLLGTSEEELTPLYMPDHSVWSGKIPVSILRQIVGKMIDDGLSPNEATEAFFGEN